MSINLGSPKTDLIEEALRIIRVADERKITMRLMGAVAFWVHCPKCRYIQKSADRVLSDIDFMAYSKQSSGVENTLIELGYEADRTAMMIWGGRRCIFHDRMNHRKVDVFFDKLEMSHDINFVNRLEIDHPTISLADMLLEKMQIVKLAEKDVVDTMMLLKEHHAADQDKETINAKYIAKLCADDWGLWQTVTMNLKKVKSLVPVYSMLTTDDQSDIIAKIDKILRLIETEPKTMKWKLRSRIGIKKKWYKDVDRGLE